MKSISKAIFRVLALSAVLLASQPASTAQTVSKRDRAYLDAMFDNIKGDKLFNYVKHLSDSTIYQGRLVGTKGMKRAVDFVCGKFSEFGLDSLPGTQGYCQVYPHVPGVEVTGKCYVRIDGRKLEWAKEWYAGGTSANGIADAEIVFAGYGVTAPELGYDDYENIDVRGKIVLIEGETPNTGKDSASIAKWYPHTFHQSKMANAVKHGAIGMIYNWAAGPNGSYDPSFIYAFIQDTVACQIFNKVGKDYHATMKEIKKTKKPASFATGINAKIKMTTTYNPDAKGYNIFGVIPGSDPVLKDEYVILAAHLDHVGMIPYHIAGSNDNLSCTAAILGVAEALAKSKVKPRRSIVLMSIDGEEAGLSGSTYYTEHPVIPKDKTKIIINLEQIGIGPKFQVGYRYDMPELADYVRKANSQYVHRYLWVYKTFFRTRPRTDGYVFMKAGYPAVDFAAYGGHNFYHDPRDSWEIQEPSTLEDAAQILYWSLINAADDEK